MSTYLVVTNISIVGSLLYLVSAATMEAPSTSGSVPGSGRKIAVCGIGVRLPGGIRSTDIFWDFLISGKDARGPVSTNRYNALGFDDSLGDKNAIKTKLGCFLD